MPGRCRITDKGALTSGGVGRSTVDWPEVSAKLDPKRQGRVIEAEGQAAEKTSSMNQRE